MAGRELAGPWHARADLFQGRPWVLTPTPVTSPVAVAAAGELARRCGGRVLLRTPAEHDRAVAAVSQLPHLLASALAARLAELAPEDLELAGQGLRDTTRIAASDPALWAAVVSLNRAALGELLDRVLADLGAVRSALAGTDAAARAVADLVARGNQGVRRLPGKHGGPADRPTAVMLVVLPDRPGELSRLLARIAALGVNVEDLRVDHAPEQPAGVVEIAIRPEAADAVSSALRGEGWTVTSGGG